MKNPFIRKILVVNNDFTTCLITIPFIGKIKIEVRDADFKLAGEKYNKVLVDEIVHPGCFLGGVTW